MKKTDILDCIKSAAAPLTKREIAEAMDIKGVEGRVKLKRLLRELDRDGTITRHPGGAYSLPDGLPSAAIIEVTAIDLDGDLLARPVEWNEDLQGPPPRIEVMPEKKGHPALKVGDRVLAALGRVEPAFYEARTIRRLDSDAGRVLGVYKATKGGGYLEPADKKARHDFEVSPGAEGGAKDGDLVIGEIQPVRGLKRKKVRIVTILGRRDDPKAISLISMHEAGLREVFPAAVIKDATGLTVPPLDQREDLRHIPLVTIDGADARDFDDAVFAEKRPAAEGGGFHLIVAIADVAHYVRPESPLDQEAQLRGNSTYFPDRVVPMLPEALSNDLCSLRPDEDRACMAAHLWIDDRGELTRHTFVRGLMRSRARLIYEQVQNIYDTKSDPALLTIINPLYEAFAVLDEARRKRGALELDLPERQVVLDNKGNMIGVKPRLRVDAHRLIEEFMILANVAAAETLERKKSPCVYRVHDKPSADKLESARDFLESFNLSLPRGHGASPGQLNGILKAAKDMEYAPLISQTILRCQSQAHYSIENIGHFGLALKRYAHFTSPIRRYADLLVHRALIAAGGLGEGGMREEDVPGLEQLCDQISACERSSMEAERNSIERFTAAFLSERVGARFAGRITGVTRFGLFVQLDESGADGLVPIRSLPDDFYIHDERAHALIGRRWGRVYQLGARVTVRLMEADGLTGSTLLALDGHDNGAEIPGIAVKRSFEGPEFRAKKGQRRKHYGPPKDRNDRSSRRGPKGRKPGGNGKKRR